MKNLIFATLLLSSFNLWAQSFPAPGYSDQTDREMQRLKNDIELLEEKTIEGIQVKLHLAQSAKKAIAKKAFLVADPDFSQEKLNAYIFKNFESSLAYYRSISPGNELSELNLVIIDEGGDKGTISEVPVHSRIVLLHLVRWHKYYLKNTEHYTAVSSIHEFGHIMNYMYSPKETKFHREMTGILLECLNFIRLYGIEFYTKAYPYYYTSKITDLSLILKSEYTNMNVLRNLAFVFFTNVHNGTYKGSADAVQLLETLTIAYLKNPTDDSQGLDEVFKQAGLTDAEGKTLTLATLQNDTKTYVDKLPK